MNFPTMTPTRWILAGVAVVILLVLIFGGYGWVMSRKYDKDRLEYQKKEEAWSTERTKLIADAEAKEKRIAELEPQVLAYKAAADAGKKVDDDLAKEIEAIGKEAGDDEARAAEPADCNDRARRVCELLRTNRIPHDCGAITRESCSR